MYARHYSHSTRDTAAAAAPDRSTQAGSAHSSCPPVLRLVPPLGDSVAANARATAAPRPATAAVPGRARKKLLASEAGMATAEYAIATLAAVGFAGLLVLILRSEEVRGFLLTLIRTALALP